MGNIFSNHDHQQQTTAIAAAAAAASERQRQYLREYKAAQERRRQEKEEQERQRQEQERERERLLQQARTQAALRLRHLRPRSPFTPSSFDDKYDDSYADRDWEWHFDIAQVNYYNNNDYDYDYDVDDNDGARDDGGYTGSDGYYRIPQHNHHLRHRQNQGDNEYPCRGLRKTNKAYTPPSGKGRRRRGRKGKGDLYENDYHAGHSKSEIMAMSSERKAAFEAQKLRREQ